MSLKKRERAGPYLLPGLCLMKMMSSQKQTLEVAKIILKSRERYMTIKTNQRTDRTISHNAWVGFFYKTRSRNHMRAIKMT